MPKTTTNLGLPSPDTHSDTFTPQEDIEALADSLDALAPYLGLSGPSIKRRGKSIITTEEPRTNTAYGLLTTPDRVQNIAVPAESLLVVAYQATWKCSVAQAARAAIFIGANQLKATADNAAAPAVSEASHRNGGADVYVPLFSTGQGLGSSSGPANYSGDVTTGQAFGLITGASGYNAIAPGEPYKSGGPCQIFGLPAGTYDISVQFKASSGSVTAKNRKLWVWTVGF